ncbi:MAG: hypothetical protein ACK5IB_08380 [Qingshengfaniella sp.]
MIRLILWVAIFCAGLWAGAKYERVNAIDACLNAGGQIGADGVCRGVAVDG